MAYSNLAQLSMLANDVDAALEVLASNLSIELAHGYLKPIQVDENVGLLAVVGEGMRGTPGLAGRVFTAISRERINIIAIAQGSSEITIGIVVGLEGLERAVPFRGEETVLELLQRVGGKCRIADYGARLRQEMHGR